MIRYLNSRAFWGIMLILGGCLFLLQNIFGWEFGQLFWAVIFVIGGLAFVSVYLSDRQMWWGLIPGFTLIGIGFLIGLTAVSEQMADAWGGPLVLGSIGAAFLAVYLANRNAWWPIIPAGTMLTLAVVAGLESWATGLDAGGFFFLGIGLTFVAVALVPGSGKERNWAWIPAGILTFMGIMVSIASSQLLGYIWPVIIIVAGAVLIVRTNLFRKE